MGFNRVAALFITGGPFMYPLLVFLFISLFFCIERAIAYTRFNWRTGFGEIKWPPPAGGRGEETGFPGSLHRNWRRYSDDGKMFNTFMELDCRELVRHLEQNLNYLSAVSTLAPITGFLGTVTGMIIAFRDIIRATDVSPQLVANGIYEALITTAGGLIITIFSSFFYFLFTGIIERYKGRMEYAVNRVYKQIVREGGKTDEPE